MGPKFESPVKWIKCDEMKYKSALTSNLWCFMASGKKIEAALRSLASKNAPFLCSFLLLFERIFQFAVELGRLPTPINGKIRK